MMMHEAPIKPPNLNPNAGTPPPSGPTGPDSSWKNPKRLLTGGVIVLLLIISIAEGVIIYQQKRVNEQIEAQSQEALGRFLKQGKTAKEGGIGTNLLLRNVHFCWSRQICVDTRQLTATAYPLDRGNTVVFDDIKSFMMKVHNASVLISPRTLEGMFNESVFNYPGSNLRDLKVTISQGENNKNEAGDNRIQLNGSLKYFLWIPFEMDTDLKVDRKSNTLVISVKTLKVFGFIPATWLIDFNPFNLQKLLPLPPNKHLTISKNLMMVKPFGLFPPPRLDGQMTDIRVTPRLIQLQFSGTDPAFSNIPQAGASNYIYLQGGNAQFGRIRMLDAQAQVLDKNESNYFSFSLLGYLNYLPLSQVQLLDSGGAVLRMPDRVNIPDTHQTNVGHDGRVSHEQAIDPQTGKPHEPSFWERTRAKLKEWFGF
jgi:hypothetical protein